MGREVIVAETGVLLKQFNITTLTIIPKSQNPVGLTDCRPIACCSIIYKIITKILTKRIGGILKRIVSPAQSAFIHGKKIIDNILLTHELVRN